MTDQEMNEAIARACGWTDLRSVRSSFNSSETWTIGKVPNSDRKAVIPFYTSNLNAMHEAEALKASDMLWCQNYQEKLRYACDASGFDWETCFIWHATARQRAEAFLRTLGLFTE